MKNNSNVPKICFVFLRQNIMSCNFFFRFMGRNVTQMCLCEIHIVIPYTQTPSICPLLPSQGTVIRVFSIPEGLRLFEFRRGMKRYNANDDSKLIMNIEDTLIIQKESWRRLCRLWYVRVCFWPLCVCVTKGMSTSAPFPSARMLSSSVPQAIQRRCTFSSLNSTAQGIENAPCYQCNWLQSGSLFYCQI